MARLPRYIVPGQPQHVIQRGNNRAAMFANARDYSLFHSWLTVACEKYGCQVHAYVLMTNHVHLLMTPQTRTSTAKVMQAVGVRYVKYFNSAYARTGTLWEGRYRATPIDSEFYLLACYRYIELNPVRAHLVTQPGDYPWSSYRFNARGSADALVTPHDRFSLLGADDLDRRVAYRALFEISLGNSVMDEIRDATNTGWPLGEDRFRDEIAHLLARRTRPLAKGGGRSGAGRPSLR